MLPFLVAILATAVHPEDPDDFLEPVEVTIPAYERALERALQEDLGVRRLEMKEAPSFTPEQAVTIYETDGGAYTVLAVRAAVNQWYGKKREGGGDPIRCVAPISGETFAKLHAVWDAAIARARSRDDAWIDATSYTFGLFDPGKPSRKALAMSPRARSRNAELVELAHGFFALACADPSVRARADRSLGSSADALLARLRAR
jgi:hypothetical protein